MGPLTAKSEFQHFAEEAAGRPLQVYGRQLFDEVPTTFAPADNIPVPADYVIGPGDELLIRAWGKIDLDSRVTVDRNGQISLPKIGTLSVAGVRYEELESHLRFTIGNLYKDFELNVTLGRLRSIQIYVLGSARQPGLYTVSSLSTLVNALFASGGPSATGSMRHIQLRRADQLVRDFDIYDLVRSGDKSHDLQLLPGDVIYISPVGPQIAVLGSVNEPGIYELRGDTTIASALQFSGGLTSLAGTDRVLLERIEDHRARRVDQFGLDASGMQRLIQDGDVLRVFPLSPRFENAVTLHGNVSQPGRYAWHEGMRVSDLIPTRDFLVTRMYWNKQNHMPQPDVAQQFRSRPAYTLEDQFNDQSGGAPLVQAEKDSTAQFFGKQNNQSEMERPDQHATPRTYQRVQDQKADLTDGDHTSAMANIGRNSAEINWEYAVIERLDEQDLSTHLIPFRLADAIDNHASPDNQILKAGDIVTIFSRADLELPIEKHAAFVRVGGEVNAPGMYRVKPGETLREVVEQAGGLTSHSYLYASLFTRVSTRKAQEDQLQRSADEMQRELISRYANASPQAGQTGADQQAQLALQQAALAKLTSIKPTGRIGLSLPPMRAAWITTLDGPESVTIRETDEPAANPAAVRIDVAAAGITFPDVLLSRGAYQYKPELPFVPGAEVAGVVRTAPADSGFAPGQRVAAFPSFGGFAEVVDVKPGMVFALPDRLSFAEACALPMNYLTMHFALTHRAPLRQGETVLVHGAAGGIGTAALQLVRAYGARSIAVVSSEEKAAVAKAAGAEDVVMAAGFREQVAALTGGAGVDMVVDPVGGDRFTDSLRSLATGGRLLVIGFAGGEIPTVKVNRLLLNNIGVVGVGWGAYVGKHPEYPRYQWQELLPLLEAGQLVPPIGTAYPLADAAIALADMDGRKAKARSVLLMAQP